MKGKILTTFTLCLVTLVVTLYSSINFSKGKPENLPYWSQTIMSDNDDDDDIDTPCPVKTLPFGLQPSVSESI